MIARTVDGQTLSYMYNGHADVTALLDNTGAIVATYYYDAFGNIVEQTGNVNNSITYAGYQYDKEAGLYYLNARMYEPVTARFLQEDTYRGDRKDPLSLNLYTYCYNEPMIYTDPDGHFAIVSSIASRVVTNIIKQAVSNTTSKKSSSSSSKSKSSSKSTASISSSSTNNSTFSSVVNNVFTSIGVSATEWSELSKAFGTINNSKSTSGVGRAYEIQKTNSVTLDDKTNSITIIADTRAINTPRRDAMAIMATGAGITQVDSPAPGPADIVGGIVVGVGAGVWVYEQCQHYIEYQQYLREKSISDAITNIKTKDPKSTIIYRTGSGNATNLTPRPTDYEGLSYTTNIPTEGKFTMTTMEIINKTGVLKAVKDGFTHVSVRPIENATMQGWIDSRQFAIFNPHPYTTLLQNISLKF